MNELLGVLSRCLGCAKLGSSSSSACGCKADRSRHAGPAAGCMGVWQLPAHLLALRQVPQIVAAAAAAAAAERRRVVLGALVLAPNKLHPDAARLDLLRIGDLGGRGGGDRKEPGERVVRCYAGRRLQKEHAVRALLTAGTVGAACSSCMACACRGARPAGAHRAACSCMPHLRPRVALRLCLGKLE